LEIGIVGLPNVGKSSLFNALTAATVAAENFPFTTIEPNVGVVPVQDERLDILEKIYKAPKKVPASIKFVDIAGLVPGASQGEGLGNKFLSHIRSVDAIAQVIRCFEDKDVVNVLGDLDPIKDADVISTELLLADLEQTEKIREKWQGSARSGVEDARKKLSLLESIHQDLQKGLSLRKQNRESEAIKEFNFLTAKPVLFVANVGENINPQLVDSFQKWANKENAQTVNLNAKLEAEVMALPEDERRNFREAMGVEESGLSCLAKAGEKLLNLITFFAAGPKEVHAWHVKRGSSVLEAAGKIHSDMEKGFIRAEIFSASEIKDLGSEAALRAKGKIRMEGRDYFIQDGDVVYIHFKV